MLVFFPLNCSCYILNENMIISLITIYSCIKGIFLVVVWLSSLLTRNYSLFCATLVILDVEKEDGRQL